MNTYASRYIPMTGEVEARAFSGHIINPPAPTQPQAPSGTRSRGPIRMLRLGQVLALTGLSRTKIYVLQAKGDFPLRVQLTPKRVGWVEADVQAWLAARIASTKPLAER